MKFIERIKITIENVSVRLCLIMHTMYSARCQRFGIFTENHLQVGVISKNYSQHVTPPEDGGSF